jgi:hypothetical protein
VTKLDATEAYFIKLGRRGVWERECLRDGTLRFGYSETPHDLCVNRDWEAVRQIWLEKRGSAGAATNDIRQIRAFYEADENAIYLTFAGGLLHWCRPSGPVSLLPDQGNDRKRATIDGWHSTSVGGTPLTVDRLSGQLLKVQMFQGTICRVKPFDYLIRKLGDELSPEIIAADEAERALLNAIVSLMRLLTWQDFELLVDLVFSSSGWRRVSVVGRTQKTVDIDMILPTTDERAFVQVKSQANAASLRDYADRFKESETYDRMFFVWHTGNIDSPDDLDNVTLIGPERLSQMVLDAGLASWLREKVA